MNQAHLHLILAHFPVVGAIAALALLLRAYFSRTEESFRLAAFATILVAVTAGAAYLTGEGAEHQVEKIVTEASIESHESAAQVALVTAMIAGAFGIVSLATRYIGRLAVFTTFARTGLLITLMASVTMFGITAERGGSIRHTEIVDTAGTSVGPQAKDEDEHKE